MKRIFAGFAAVVLVFGLLAACGGDEGRERIYIPLAAEELQHPFWQIVYAGAQAAAEAYEVDISFIEPAGGAQAGLFEKVSNNLAAAAIGADSMFTAIREEIAGAAPESPVYIVILVQDLASISATERARGFAERMLELAAGANGSAAILGSLPAINTGEANAAVRIKVAAGMPDMANAARDILNTAGLIGVFCPNEAAAEGLLAAIHAGAALPEGVILVGFGAGSAQKEAVRSGLMMGAVTQDPFQIGYQAVSMAVRAARGEVVLDVDTGARWWTASNMDDPVIAGLLYD